MKTRTEQTVDLLKPFEGCTIDNIDLTSKPQMVVVRLRRPGGKTVWVALGGAFDLGVTATELPDGHRFVRQIRSAELAAAGGQR